MILWFALLLFSAVKATPALAVFRHRIWSTFATKLAYICSVSYDRYVPVSSPLWHSLGMRLFCHYSGKTKMTKQKKEKESDGKMNIRFLIVSHFRHEMMMAAPLPLSLKWTWHSTRVDLVSKPIWCTRYVLSLSRHGRPLVDFTRHHSSVGHTPNRLYSVFASP